MAVFSKFVNGETLLLDVCLAHDKTKKQNRTRVAVNFLFTLLCED